MPLPYVPPPPFARDLSAEARDIWLFFGAAEAWGRVRRQRALGWRNALLLPPGRQPEDYDWACLRGRSLVIVELAATSGAFRQRLVLELAGYGIAGAYLIASSRCSDDAVRWNGQPPTRGEHP
jgi:hypothetical protein